MSARTAARGWRPLFLALALFAGCREQVRVPPNDLKQDDPAPAWNDLLGEIVTADGYVDYDYLERYHAPLDAYVAWLAQTQVPKNTLKRKAFWLNAYNALAIWSVLDTGRPGSVRDVRPHPFGRAGYGFFFHRAFDVGLDRVSLWDIEHERLRLRTMDYRIHGAISCGARSCPPLRASLYEHPGVDRQLAEQMHRWINDPVRGVRVDDGVAVFSQLFDWFAHDFEFWTGGKDLCTIAARHADDPLRQSLEELATNGCPHEFAPYDWSLNDAK